MQGNLVIRIHLLLLLAVLMACHCVSPFLASAADKPLQRFFLMGSGKLSLNNLRNNRQATVSLLNTDGSFNTTAFDKVDWIFGFPAKEKGEHISPRMLCMLSYFSDRIAPGKTIHIESGYRSPEYNTAIRSKGANAARTSTHIDGMALDFWIEGVDGKYLWETIRAKNCAGVGHYGGKTIHFDAGRPRFWEAATSGAKSTEPDYNRHLYLSTGFDRYAPQEQLRLSLSGISTFGFGVQSSAWLEDSTGNTKQEVPLGIGNNTTAKCLVMDSYKSSRFLTTTLPARLPAGQYRVQVAFCQRPFEQMPVNIISNVFEVAPERSTKGQMLPTL